ncbi:MAG: sulfur carrier protein ThiS [Planctomycetota bacterium]
MSIPITVNGQFRDIDSSWTISHLLADLKIESRYCAVERNLEVIPRERHAECRLNAGDRIEIVTLVGGG